MMSALALALAVMVHVSVTVDCAVIAPHMTAGRDMHSNEGWPLRRGGRSLLSADSDSAPVDQLKQGFQHAAQLAFNAGVSANDLSDLLQSVISGVVRAPMACMQCF